MQQENVPLYMYCYVPDIWSDLIILIPDQKYLIANWGALPQNDSRNTEQDAAWTLLLLKRQDTRILTSEQQLC